VATKNNANQEVIPVNTKAKDTFFKKVYEKEERQRALVSFLLGLDGKKISMANVRPVLFGNKENDFACFSSSQALYAAGRLGDKKRAIAETSPV